MTRNRKARRPQSGKTNRRSIGSTQLSALARQPLLPFGSDAAKPPLNNSLSGGSLPTHLGERSRGSYDGNASQTFQTQSLTNSRTDPRKRRPVTARPRTRKPEGFNPLSASTGATRLKTLKRNGKKKKSDRERPEGMNEADFDKLQVRIEEIKSILQQRYKGKSSLRGVFLSWDANRDGMVDEHELKDILGMCGCHMSTIEARQICQSFGPEGDTIPYDGFVDLVFEEQTVDFSEQERTTEFLRQRLRDLGLTDEQINREREWRQKRGMWALKEVIPRLRDKYRKKKSLAKEFREIDVNHDGFVSKDELKSLLARLGYDVPPQDIDDLFLRIDNSGNDTVEYDEFIEVVFPPEQIEPTFYKNQRISNNAESEMLVDDGMERIVVPRSPPPKSVLEHIAQNNDPTYSTVSKVVLVPKQTKQEQSESGCSNTCDSANKSIPTKSVPNQTNYDALVDDKIQIDPESKTKTRSGRGYTKPGCRRRFGTRNWDSVELFEKEIADEKRPSGLRKAVRAAHLRERVGKVLREGFNGNSMEGFHIFDENGDGQISYTEFKKAMGKLKVGLGASDAELLLNYMDRNNSGYVGYDEFCRLISCNHVGTLSTQDLRTIEDAHRAEKVTNGGLTSVDSIGYVDRSLSAVSLNLAKKTCLQRRLFPTQHVQPEPKRRPHTAGPRGSSAGSKNQLEDSYYALRNSSSSGGFHISNIRKHLGYEPRDKVSEDKLCTKMLLRGTGSFSSQLNKQENLDSTTQTENARYGGGERHAYRNQPSQSRAKSRREKRLEVKKSNHARHLGESPSEAFSDHLRVNERRLRTIVRQRLGYYEALQYRMAKDRARSAMLI